MAIHLFLDAALTQRISSGDGSSPDSDTFNGTDGEVKDREIFVANEQTTLAAAIDGVQTAITLTGPAFADGETIVIGTEQMQVVSGGGTVNLTVVRGFSGTGAVAHSISDAVFSGYDYSSIVIDPVDETGTDESVWYKLALTQAELDTAAQSDPLSLGDKPHGQTISFWRRCTVLPGTPVQNNTDIKLRLTATENPVI